MAPVTAGSSCPAGKNVDSARLGRAAVMSVQCTVLGAGAWGTALACHLSHAGPVKLWARRAELATEIATRRSNPQYLPDVHLPDGISVTTGFAEAVAFAGADGLIILATPVAGLPAALTALAGHGHLPPIVGVAKGIDPASGELPHQLAARLMPDHSFGVLSGPSFAAEVARELPCALVAAGDRATTAQQIQQVFHRRALRVYLSDDLLGVELAGALKNVMALAAGIADGLALGDNARAALVTRGLAEMTRLGVALGAQPSTFMGLAGLGDLMLTCTGGLSRNRRVGLALATGQPVAQITRSLGHVAEGVPCCAAALAQAAAVGVDLPIASAVQAVIDQRQTARDAVSSLLARDPIAESQ